MVACVEKLKYIIIYSTYESCDWMQTAAIGDTKVPNLKMVMQQFVRISCFENHVHVAVKIICIYGQEFHLITLIRNKVQKL